MPGFDGTGPRGQGPMTGGGRGYCAVPMPAGAYRPVGRGAYYGRGGGRGWRHWYYAGGVPGWSRASMGLPAWGYPYMPEVAPQQEMDMLKTQADFLRKQLEDIQNRIETLEKSQAGKDE